MANTFMTSEELQAPSASKSRTPYKSTALFVVAVFIGLALLNIPCLTNLVSSTARSRLRQSAVTQRLGPVNMVYSTKPAGTGEPKISAKEEREWNHMADGMDRYHSHFRHSFDSIYEVSL